MLDLPPKVSSLMVKVEEEIKKAVGETELDFLWEKSHSFLSKGGKRVRPLLALLSHLVSGGGKEKEAIILATSIELVHAASLIHDDIMDEARERRWGPSLHLEVGLRRAIVIGDYLFVKAFTQASKIGGRIPMEIGRACSRMAEGQLLQEEYRFSEISIEKYLEIVKRKTSSLFSVACKCGGLLSHRFERELELFGEKYGVIYQICDDVLDVVGLEEFTGKTRGSDVRGGFFTAPSILSLESLREAGDMERAKRFSSIVKSRWNTESDVEFAIRTMVESGGVDKSLDLCREYVSQAIKIISELPNSEYREALEKITLNTLERTKELAGT